MAQRRKRGSNVVAACIAVAAALVLCASAHAQAGKPNIVLILMDNLGYGELGVYGGGILRGAPTSRIDKLASEGLRLTNYNVEAQCTPSRAALMTGRYAFRTGNGSVPIDTPRYGHLVGGRMGRAPPGHADRGHRRTWHGGWRDVAGKV